MISGIAFAGVMVVQSPAPVVTPRLFLNLLVPHFFFFTDIIGSLPLIGAIKFNSRESPCTSLKHRQGHGNAKHHPKDKINNCSWQGVVICVGAEGGLLSAPGPCCSAQLIPRIVYFVTGFA